MRFDWDDGNREHIKRHEVTSAEAEEALRSGKLLHAEIQDRSAEFRFVVLAPTKAKRLLSVTFTMRGDRVRIVTARQASRKERRIYAEYEKREQEAP